MAAVEGGETAMSELLHLRRMLSLALAQVDAMVAARPIAREPIERIGAVVIDRAARRVLVNDEEVRLPHIEYELLVYMLVNVGRLLPSDELIMHIWPGRNAPLNPTNALKVHIRWLREKLSDRAPFRIVNVRGEGYRLDPLDNGHSLAADGTAP